MLVKFERSGLLILFGRFGGYFFFVFFGICDIVFVGVFLGWFKRVKVGF